MSAARKSAFNRNSAIASIQINWKAMSPDGDRDERLAWISEFLGREVGSLTDLTDYQLGSVAGEMKRLTGQTRQTSQPSRTSTSRTTSTPSRATAIVDNVIEVDFSGRPSSKNLDAKGDGETVFLSSPELVYTLEKLLSYIGWNDDQRIPFMVKRFGTENLKMLTFKKATVAVNTFLRIAAHQDLKIRNGADKPVSRKEINKYVPMLKERLSIDRQN